MDNNIYFKNQHNEIKSMMSLINGHIENIIILANRMRNIITFKSTPNHNLEQEFWECDNRLRFVYLSYALAMYIKFKYKTTITCILRYQEEQDNIYLNVEKLVNGIWVRDTEAIEKYKIEKWKSPHQPFLTPKARAIDYSTNDMNEEEEKFTDLYLSDIQVVYTGEHNTLLRHSVGKNGKHNHFQVDPDEFTSIRRTY